MSGRKPTSFAHGVVAAAVLSVSGAAVLAALTPFLGAGTALRAVIALLGFAYVLYVQSVSGERVGRVTTIVLWLLAATATWVVGVPFVGYVLIHAGLLWLVRSLYFYSGVLPALLDLGLSALGLAFAVWAAGRSGSPCSPSGVSSSCKRCTFASPRRSQAAWRRVSTTRSKRSTAPTKRPRRPCAGCPRCGSPRLAIPSFITETKS